MDNSTIALKPVKDLLGMNFFIPDYQRGYRWTAQQATDLLEDIWTFVQKEKSHTEIYCIQPLVVQRKTEDIRSEIQKRVSENAPDFVSQIEKILKGSWNVVDGQQRLTTIRLILTALGESSPYVIDYQTRPGSKVFLCDIENASAQDNANENIDFFHIYHVYKTAKEWLEKRDDEGRRLFKTCLLEKVNFIWYQIPDECDANSRTEAISAFTRLNIGKIPLTDAELIKALFLNRTNFSCATADLESQQRKIAMDWDRIEYTLQDDAFWLFLHDKKYDKPTRIDFILDMICQDDVFNVYEVESYRGKEERIARNNERRKKIGNDEHQTFRYFYYVFTDKENTITEELLQERWDIVRRYFQIFNEWFHDYKLYHYIGYLTTISEDKNLIRTLIKEWGNSSKESFEKTIKNRIFGILSGNKGFYDLDNFVYEEEYKGQTVSKRKCVPILLLHNIETIVQQNDKLVADDRYALPNFTKFPFHLYKSENWEVEHIRPNAGDKIQSEPARKLYARLAAQYLPNENGLHVMIDEYLHPDKYPDRKTTFEDVLGKILEADQSLPDSDKNKIWNYTLLDGQTNKEYGNVIFPIKRAFLANKERGYKINYKFVGDALNTDEKKDEIAFVPPCTRNVFAKFYTDVPNGLLEWTDKDARAYLEDIKLKLDDYLKIAEVTPNE